MGRLKLLVTNIFYFGGLKILSSLFPLLLYPYISRLISPTEFGLYDIFMVVVGLSTSISMLGVQDAMFKEYHEGDDEDQRKLVVSTGFCLVFASSLIFSLILICFKSFFQDTFFGNLSYDFIIYYVAGFLILTNITNVLVHPSRLENNKKELIYHTLLFAVLFYAASIILLNYIPNFLSLVYGNTLTLVVIGVIFGVIHFKKIYPFKFSNKTAKLLLTIGLPLVPIFVIYWANNSIMRVMIMQYLGSNELGVFAIGSKYAAISTFIQAAFAGGWSYFTFSTMKDQDQVEIKSKVFESLLFIIVIAYLFITPTIPYLFELLFIGEYVRGYTVFGQLFLGPLLLILYQIIANQFTIIGKSYYSLISLAIGFLIGVFICYIFIRKGFGIIGASYSIPISYSIAIFIAYFLGKKYDLFIFSKNVYISFAFLIVINITFLLTNGINTIFLSLIIFIVYLVINRKHLKLLFDLLKPFLKKTNK